MIAADNLNTNFRIIKIYKTRIEEKNYHFRFLKSKVAILQTELEAGKNLNDTLEKENTKNTRKIKKLQTHVDKSNAKIDSLESSLKSFQEKTTSADETLKVRKTFKINLINVFSNNWH